MILLVSELSKTLSFNRNILYCKFFQQDSFFSTYLDLIGTFCIVNKNIKTGIVIFIIDLIGTFCIVNFGEGCVDFPKVFI